MRSDRSSIRCELAPSFGYSALVTHDPVTSLNCSGHPLYRFRCMYYYGASDSLAGCFTPPWTSLYLLTSLVNFKVFTCAVYMVLNAIDLDRTTEMKEKTEMGPGFRQGSLERLLRSVEQFFSSKSSDGADTLVLGSG